MIRWTEEEKEQKRLAMARTALDLMLVQGLENTTTRQICNACKINQNTLYYYFLSKDNLILKSFSIAVSEAENMVLKKAIVENTGLENVYINVVKNASDYVDDIRFIYQVTGSPVYHDKIVEYKQTLPERYDHYGRMFADHVGLDYDVARPYIFMFITVLMDYILCDCDERVREELEIIYKLLENLTK